MTLSRNQSLWYTIESKSPCGSCLWGMVLEIHCQSQLKFGILTRQPNKIMSFKHTSVCVHIYTHNYTIQVKHSQKIFTEQTHNSLQGVTISNWSRNPWTSAEQYICRYFKGPINRKMSQPCVVETASKNIGGQSGLQERKLCERWLLLLIWSLLALLNTLLKH